MKNFCLLIISILCFQGYAQEKFEGLAAGPYKKLVIRGAMVIPGHGGPPVGPYDIVIKGDQITDMIPFDPVTAKSRGEVKEKKAIVSSMLKGNMYYPE